MKLIWGDSTIELKLLKDNSVDSIVTDPPYGISFMAKKWDYAVPSVELWKEALRVLKPGGHILCACGTRTQHRMAVNIEDAGFEIRDIVAWVYGSGFPKSLNIGKAVDKFQGNDRETIREYETHDIRNNALLGKKGNMTVSETKGTSPYEGQGTALKPAVEYWTWASKPNNNLTTLKEYAILDSVENNIGDLIWQSLVRLQKVDTSKLLEKGLIPLSIALLWQNILVELCSKENKSTISMESRQIIELKILNSLLLKNTQENTAGKSQIYQNGTQKYQANGLNVFVNIAEKALGDLNHTKNDLEITTLIATEVASLKIKPIGLNALSAESDLEMLNATVSSVLQNVLTSLITEKNKNELATLVKFAEKCLQLSLAENQNIAQENVCLSPIRNIIPNLSLWTLARKPLSEKTIAQNVLKHGTGGINIDECRVGTTGARNNGNSNGTVGSNSIGTYGKAIKKDYNMGRFPANLIHDGSDEVVGLFPDTKSGGGKKGNVKNGTGMFGSGKAFETEYVKPDSGSASRFFKKCKYEMGDLCQDQSLISFAQYVESKLTSQEKHTVQEVVEILVSQEDVQYQQELRVIQDFIGNCKKCTPTLNLVLCVEKKENIDTIQIIINLLRLFGCVSPVITSCTPETKKSELKRLIYTPKASKSERNKGLEGFEEKVRVRQGLAGEKKDTVSTNSHPTVKPIKLMQYLCRLITPKDGIVLDPFMGSGSTGIACKLEGFDFIGIERDSEYMKIAEAKINNTQKGLF